MEEDDTPQGRIVYRRLIDEIQSGKLLAGARLREVDLAARLGHSRTPIREAIRLLEADGLISHLPRVGAVVRTIDYAEVVELYEMRIVLEATAARLACRGASEAEILQLREINAAFAAAADDEAAALLNRQFHATLLQASRNRYLLRAMEGLHKALLLLGPTTLHDSNRSRSATSEHEAIIDALARRDDATAADLMRQHMEAAQLIRLRSFTFGRSTTA